MWVRDGWTRRARKRPRGRAGAWTRRARSCSSGSRRSRRTSSGPRWSRRRPRRRQWTCAPCQPPRTARMRGGTHLPAGRRARSARRGLARPGSSRRPGLPGRRQRGRRRRPGAPRSGRLCAQAVDNAVLRLFPDFVPADDGQMGRGHQARQGRIGRPARPARASRRGGRAPGREADPRASSVLAASAARTSGRHSRRPRTAGRRTRSTRSSSRLCAAGKCSAATTASRLDSAQADPEPVGAADFRARDGDPSAAATGCVSRVSRGARGLSTNDPDPEIARAAILARAPRRSATRQAARRRFRRGRRSSDPRP